MRGRPGAILLAALPRLSKGDRRLRAAPPPEPPLCDPRRPRDRAGTRHGARHPADALGRPDAALLALRGPQVPAHSQPPVRPLQRAARRRLVVLAARLPHTGGDLAGQRRVLPVVPRGRDAAAAASRPWRRRPAAGDACRGRLVARSLAMAAATAPRPAAAGLTAHVRARERPERGSLSRPLPPGGRAHRAAPSRRGRRGGRVRLRPRLHRRVHALGRTATGSPTWAGPGMRSQRAGGSAAADPPSSRTTTARRRRSGPASAITFARSAGVSRRPSSARPPRPRRPWSP